MAGEEKPCHIAIYYTLHHTRADAAKNQGLHFRKVATNGQCLASTAFRMQNFVPTQSLIRTFLDSHVNM